MLLNRFSLPLGREWVTSNLSRKSTRQAERSVVAVESKGHAAATDEAAAVTTVPALRRSCLRMSTMADKVWRHVKEDDSGSKEVAQLLN